MNYFENWRSLSKQHPFLIGIFIYLLILLYLVIWSPYTTKLETLAKQVKTQGELIAWMQKTIPLIEIERGSQTVQGSEEPLLVLIDKSIKTQNIANYNPTIQQVNANEATVTFKKISYNSLIVWLQNIWFSYHIEVKSLSLRNVSDPGLVESNITLQKK